MPTFEIESNNSINESESHTIILPDKKISASNLTFKEAFSFMVQGKKIKRPYFKGYWYIKDGKIMIHLASGDDIDSGDLHMSIMNTLAEDWQVILD